MNNGYVHLDDNAISIGGTNLTSLAILEDRIKDVTSISCSDLTIDDIDRHSDKLWILGNITGLFSINQSISKALLSRNRFVKIEFDYNFCKFRGEKPHRILTKSECSCPHGITGDGNISELYKLLISDSRHTFFMSERQRAIYLQHLPLTDFSKTSILSSCFTKDSLKLFRDSRRKDSNDKYAILKGFGGWHSVAKGLEEAENFCVSNNLPYDVLAIQPYQNHIETLSGYKGLVFLPIIDDTCPRCIIEAKLLDIEVITNINSQHVTEYWWDQDIETLEKYVSARPKYFWKTIDGIQLK